MNKYPVTITRTITLEWCMDIIETINYNPYSWYKKLDWNRELHKWYMDDKKSKPTDDRSNTHICTLRMSDPESDDEEDTVTVPVTIEKMVSALEKLAVRNAHPDAARRLVDEDYDQNDADLLIQMLAFGDIIYG
jgi:hypothetical protein